MFLGGSPCVAAGWEPVGWEPAVPVGWEPAALAGHCSPLQVTNHPAGTPGPASTQHIAAGTAVAAWPCIQTPGNSVLQGARDGKCTECEQEGGEGRRGADAQRRGAPDGSRGAGKERHPQLL